MEIFYQQIVSFLVMFLFGILFGGILDLYLKISDSYILSYKFLINITDLFLGIVFGIIGVLLLIRMNWGNLRFYIFLAILLGILFYFYLYHKIFSIG